MQGRYAKPVDASPVACSALGCSSLATIIHDQKPYCGKHALEFLEANSAAKAHPAHQIENDDGSEKQQLKNDSLGSHPFGKVGDCEEGPQQGTQKAEGETTLGEHHKLHPTAVSAVLDITGS